MKEDWIEENGMLIKIFTFPDFQAALQFVNKVGTIAEAEQHHPNISIKNYNQVVITTTTHDAGNIVTEKDRKLAGAIDVL